MTLYRTARPLCQLCSRSLRTSATFTRSPAQPLRLNAVPRPRARRLSSSASRHESRDPGGKPNDGSHSTVYDDFFNLLDSGEPPSIQVQSLSDTALTLTDGLVISQPCIFLNGQVLLWDPPFLDGTKATPGGRGWEEWGDDAWKVFEVVSPKPEIVIFGTGRTVLPPPQKVKAYLNSLGIQMDVQDTRNGASTYNMLAEEGRRVAAALLPAERQPVVKLKADEVAH